MKARSFVFPYKCRSSGFSLVEILLVIVIILMLAGALVVFVLPQQEGAQINTTKIKLKSIEQALMTYKINIGTYPRIEQGGLVALLNKPAFPNEKLGQRWQGPYLQRGTALTDAWEHPLRYELIDKAMVDDPNAPDFRLFSVGPDGMPETPDDIQLYEQTDPLAEGMDPNAPPGTQPLPPGGAPPPSPAPGPVGGTP